MRANNVLTSPMRCTGKQVNEGEPSAAVGIWLAARVLSHQLIRLAQRVRREGEEKLASFIILLKLYAHMSDE